jgi:hypothetical protein
MSIFLFSLMARKQGIPDVTPEQQLEPTLKRFALLNPEFREPMSPRAQKFYDAIFRDENGNPLPSRRIAGNIVEARIRIGAIIEQIENNRLWLELLAKAEIEEADSDGRPSRVAATPQEFDASPRTKIKTVQEVLTDAVCRLAADREDLRRNPNDMSLLTVDPGLMSDSTLRSLGLDHLIPDKRVRRPKKLAAYWMAVPLVKQTLSKLEPIHLQHETADETLSFFRMMRFPDGPNEGLILGSQGTGAPDEEKKVFFRISLDDACRQEADIHQRYRQEIIMLVAEVEAVLAEIDRRVASGWKDLKGSHELAEIQVKMAEIERKLAFVKNEHKIDARELVDRATSFKTKRSIPGRFAWNEKGERYQKSQPRDVEFDSPGAMRALWNKARRDIGKRIAQIGSIEGRLRGHATSRLLPLQIAQEAPFRDFHNDVMANHLEYRILQGAVTPEKAPVLIRNLRATRERFLTEVKFQPYLELARKLAGHIEAVITALEKDPSDTKTAAEEFTKMFVVSKMARFHVAMRNFYDTHLTSSVNHRKPYFRGMSDELKELRTSNERSRINPSKKVCPKAVRTPEYDHAFACMRDLLSDLLAKADEGRLAVKNKNDAGIMTAREEMRELVRNFNLVAILKERTDGPLPESMQVQGELRHVVKVP